jgi:hypothetical protein
VAENHFHARQAAIALLNLAKATSDRMVAAGLVEAAADLKEQAGELPGAVSAKGLSALERYRAQRRAAPVQCDFLEVVRLMSSKGASEYSPRRQNERPTQKLGAE